MACYMLSDINRRTENQDYCRHMEIRINYDSTVRGMAVADGMGGMAGGAFFSELAVKLWFEKLYRQVSDSDFCGRPLKTQIEILKQFSEQVYEELEPEIHKAGLDEGYHGGTTLSTAIHFWDTFIFSNCGDSPIYVGEGQRISLVSEVQNVAESLIRAGKTSRGSILYYQNKNRILSYLGGRNGCTPSVSCLPARKVDWVLMGSDGAFSDLDQEEIRILFSEGKESRRLPGLFQKARERGEEDNQTALFYVREKSSRSAHEKSAEMIYRKTNEENLLRETRGNEQEESGLEEDPCVYRQVEEASVIRRFRRRLQRTRNRQKED